MAGAKAQQTVAQWVADKAATMAVALGRQTAAMTVVYSVDVLVGLTAVERAAE